MNFEFFYHFSIPNHQFPVPRLLHLKKGALSSCQSLEPNRSHTLQLGQLGIDRWVAHQMAHLIKGRVLLVTHQLEDNVFARRHKAPVLLQALQRKLSVLLRARNGTIGRHMHGVALVEQIHGRLLETDVRFQPEQYHRLGTLRPVQFLDLALHIRYHHAEQRLRVYALGVRNVQLTHDAAQLFRIVFGDDQRYVQYFARLQLKTKQAKPMGRGGEAV